MALDGLFLFSAGAYLMVQANIGLSSWWALDIGIANSTGIDYGTVHNIVALAILLIDILVKEKIGWGMVADAVLIGTFVTLFNQFQLVPEFQSMFAGMICLKLTMMIVTDPRMKHTTMKGTIFSATDAIL